MQFQMSKNNLLIKYKLIEQAIAEELSGLLKETIVLCLVHTSILYHSSPGFSIFSSSSSLIVQYFPIVYSTSRMEVQNRLA